MKDIFDRYNREINYLRVSVTDKCNLRCLYCMPEKGIEKARHIDFLSLEEIFKIIEQSVKIGIKKIRLTGGEPLVKKNIEFLIRQINTLAEIEDISLTTNGILLPKMAGALKEAGLNRVNISLDTLVPDKYTHITRGGHIEDVLLGIDTAIAMKFEPVKINVVVIKGFNDDEIYQFVDLIKDKPLHVRFIEVMPIGNLHFYQNEKYMSIDEIKKTIETKYKLTELEPINGNGPAKYYSIEGSLGTIGFISPISHHFCEDCNRLRLNAEGKIRLCLLNNTELDLKKAVKEPNSEEKIVELLKQAVWDKPKQHRLKDTMEVDNRKMNTIGG